MAHRVRKTGCLVFESCRKVQFKYQGPFGVDQISPWVFWGGPHVCKSLLPATCIYLLTQLGWHMKLITTAKILKALCMCKSTVWVNEEAYFYTGIFVQVQHKGRCSKNKTTGFCVLIFSWRLSAESTIWAGTQVRHLKALCKRHNCFPLSRAVRVQ